jgi:membrane protein implicated in regulation of membrane protease activity
MLLGVFTLGFALATIAAALATFLPVWLSLLLVSLGLAAAAIAAAAGGRALLRRSGPPVPEQAMAEARATGEALRGSLHG